MIISHQIKISLKKYAIDTLMESPRSLILDKEYAFQSKKDLDPYEEMLKRKNLVQYKIFPQLVTLARTTRIHGFKKGKLQDDVETMFFNKPQRIGIKSKQPHGNSSITIKSDQLQLPDIGLLGLNSPPMKNRKKNKGVLRSPKHQLITSKIL